VNIKKSLKNFYPRISPANADFKFVLFGVFAVIFFSCASIAPVSSEIENLVPNWRRHAAGIEYYQGRIESPRLEFWALRIDLESPQIEIVCGSNAANATVSGFVRENNFTAGMNAVPFDTAGRNLGIVISGGEMLSPVHPHYDALVFYRGRNAKAAIVKQTSIESTENILNAIGGFYQILADGEITQRTLNSEPRHPRSAAGISENGKYLYLLTIDGRRAGSVGSTEKETALILQSLGSWNGINFDGGGSSALVLRYPDGSIKAINTPIHGGRPGLERAVAGCIGIYSK